MDHLEAPVCLDIYADGRLIGQTLANHYRDDLKQASLGSGRHGFKFVPPAGVTFAHRAVEVRRSLDGSGLSLSGYAESALARIAVWKTIQSSVHYLARNARGCASRSFAALGHTHPALPARRRANSRLVEIDCAVAHPAGTSGRGPNPIASSLSPF
jgi:hypothetical protein